MRIFLLVFLAYNSAHAETNAEKLIKILNFEQEWSSLISDTTLTDKTPIDDSDIIIYNVELEHRNNVNQIIMETLDWKVNKRFFIQTLNEQFTELELKNIVEFYSSDTGQKFLSSSEIIHKKHEEYFRSKYKEFYQRYEVESLRHSAELDRLLDLY